MCGLNTHTHTHTHTYTHTHTHTHTYTHKYSNSGTAGVTIFDTVGTAVPNIAVRYSWHLAQPSGTAVQPSSTAVQLSCTVIWYSRRLVQLPFSRAVWYTWWYSWNVWASCTTTDSKCVHGLYSHEWTDEDKKNYARPRDDYVV